MSYPNPSTALAEVIVDELVRAGVRLLVASPGSRSTALLLAASNRTEIEVVMAIDERSAGFHALGWAKESPHLSAVLTTSGTAVANLMPAVVEADASRTPLLVLTGDRPPELRGVGANQTIEQRQIFGRFVRQWVELGPGEREPDAPRWWRSTIASAVGAALGFASVPGPVHVNLSFREPTVPSSDDGRTATEPYVFDQQGRFDGGPWTATMRSRAPDSDQITQLADIIDASRRGVILAGDGLGRETRLTELAGRLGWPVLASVTSGLRGAEGTLATGHHLVMAHGLEPDLIVRFGSPGPSRRILEFISGSVPQLVFGSAWSDPGRVSQLIVEADVGATIDALVEVVKPRDATDWVNWWREADQLVRQILTPELVGAVSEPAVGHSVGELDADILTVGSSMPIRDMEMFAWNSPRIVANRGASGIDGFVSTALGASHRSPRSLAVGGDLSILHDANGFLCDPRPDCVFVVIDNGGGGIFSFLPQATHVGDRFERLFVTPHGRDLARLAEFHDIGCTVVTDMVGLEKSVNQAWIDQGSHIVVARTDPVDNVEEHRRLDGLAQDALGGLTPPA